MAVWLMLLISLQHFGLNWRGPWQPCGVINMTDFITTLRPQLAESMAASWRSG